MATCQALRWVSADAFDSHPGQLMQDSDASIGMTDFDQTFQTLEASRKPAERSPAPKNQSLAHDDGAPKSEEELKRSIKTINHKEYRDEMNSEAKHDKKFPDAVGKDAKPGHGLREIRLKDFRYAKDQARAEKRKEAEDKLLNSPDKPEKLIADEEPSQSK